MLVDSHCHLDRLDLDSYKGDLSSAIEAARLCGVTRMLCVGINLENAPAVVSIARQHEGIYASVGIHPMDVSNASADWPVLTDWAQLPEVVAIGETGLDYHYAGNSARQQQESFIRHLNLSSQLHKPVIVHTRDAREDTIGILREHADSDVGGVLHCFTENWAMAKQALDLGFYLSFSGIITFSNASELRDIAARVPLDRLLIETDSPYLAPAPYRGQQNEPRYVVEVANKIAELHGISPDKIAEITSQNFDKLFF